MDAVSKLKHLNIAATIEFSNNELLYLITEDYTALNLKEYVATNGRLSDTEVLRISKSIADALTIMHMQHVAHGGLDSRAICFDFSMIPKLSYFDFACDINIRKIEKVEVNIMNYFPPEFLQFNSNNQFTKDAWCLGIITYFMICAQYPFISANQIKLVNIIIKCQYMLPPTTHPTIHALIAKTLVQDPSQRANARYISMMLRSVEAAPQRQKILRKFAQSQTLGRPRPPTQICIEEVARCGQISFRRVSVDSAAQAPSLPRTRLQPCSYTNAVRSSIL
ncbi:CAMK family protein kinase [Trichomonas vaginalis G3]|uniref:CAMK family protein kinase n=1 Tax=Trichomonas vaginalis (strain ATCC PRA-98 / G3) TaxID=412133 RepID=A2FE90_TRIV3|nr:protein kinase protein [Trichomonas vaginalis G3]EAX96781.1 CAMK family protein kinase [Trichomonas vaginalis G3]KAI5552824.1 protein kinase protein [Trichomonas vaginalis G3]|eukprot:XP_001309711.1 CAMK family protein kinase [Trichomonas vaginalis G3]